MVQILTEPLIFYSTCDKGIFYCTEMDCRVDCQISEYKPLNCSESCGPGVIVGVAEIIIQPEHGGDGCPPLEKVLDTCYLQDCRK